MTPIPESDGEKAAQRKKEFDALAERRAQMLAAEQELQRRRQVSQKEEKVRSEKTYLTQVADEKQRREDRETWRQDQHGKRAEEIREKMIAEEEKKHQRELKQKAVVAEEKKKSDMVALHEIAVERKIASRLKTLDKEEHDLDEHVDEITMRAFQDVDAEFQRSIVAIQRSAQKKQADENALFERHRKLLDDSYVRDRHALDMETRKEEIEALNNSNTEVDIQTVRLNAGRKRMQIESTRKRQILTLDEERMDHLAKIAQETEGLQREAHKLAADKKQRLHDDALRRKKEVTKHRETAEKWIGLEDPEEQKKESEGFAPPPPPPPKKLL